MSKLIGVVAGLATLGMVASAEAATWRFDGVLPGPMAVDTPVNATTGCGSPGFDFCDVAGAGFEYAVKGGISFTAQGLANGLAAEIIQDIQGVNQGLGVQSEGRFSLDQVNGAAGESILFSFSEEVSLKNVEFNDGIGQDCPGGSMAEGDCGTFNLVIDRGLASERTLSDIVAIAVVAGGWVGTTFEFIHNETNGGFSIAALSVPLPAALPLFLAGAGLLGASSGRRRKDAK